MSRAHLLDVPSRVLDEHSIFETKHEHASLSSVARKRRVASKRFLPRGTHAIPQSLAPTYVTVCVELPSRRRFTKIARTHGFEETWDRRLRQQCAVESAWTRRSRRLVVDTLTSVGCEETTGRTRPNTRPRIHAHAHARDCASILARVRLTSRFPSSRAGESSEGVAAASSQSVSCRARQRRSSSE